MHNKPQHSSNSEQNYGDMLYTNMFTYRQQAIICTNDDLVYRCTYATIDLSNLIQTIMDISVDYN